MHMTAFLILGYNRETYMFDITTLIFGAVSLVFSAVCGEASGQVLLRGLPAYLDGDAVSDGCEPDYFTEGGAFSGTQTADVDVHWLAGMSFLPTFFRWIPRFEMFEWVYIIGCYLLLLSTRFFGVSKYGSTNWLAIGRLPFSPRRLQSFCLYSTLRAYSARGWNGSSF